MHREQRWFPAKEVRRRDSETLSQIEPLSCVHIYGGEFEYKVSSCDHCCRDLVVPPKQTADIETRSTWHTLENNIHYRKGTRTTGSAIQGSICMHRMSEFRPPTEEHCHVCTRLLVVDSSD